MTFCKSIKIDTFCESIKIDDVVGTLKVSLETRKLVDRAKALLIKNGMTEPQAHRKIQKLAMDKRKSISQETEAILLTEG